MARLKLTVFGDPRAGDTYYVSVKGRLSRRDLKRLEALCGKALERHTPLLEIRLINVTAIDADARAFVERLRARGAIIIEKRRRPKASPQSSTQLHPTMNRTSSRLATRAYHR